LSFWRKEFLQALKVRGLEYMASRAGHWLLDEQAEAR
jgi:hypothetical protein